MEDLADFVRRVWIWKSCGITAWSLLYIIFYLAPSLFLALGQNQQIDAWAIPLALIADILPIFTYIRCLGLLPVRFVVLSLQEIQHRCQFFASTFLCFFVNLFVFSNIHNAFYEALLLTFLLILQLDFAIPIFSDHDSRKVHIEKAYHVPWRSFIVIAATGPFIGITGAVASILLFRLATMTLCMCAVVCSERTSFAQKNSCERLAHGLHSKSSIVRYWAYCDLLDVARDEKPNRRGFLFNDDGERFRDVAFRVIELLDTFTLKHQDLAESELEYTPVHKMASPKWKRGGEMKSAFEKRKPVRSEWLENAPQFLKKFGVPETSWIMKGLSYFESFMAWKDGRKERMIREDLERKAMQDGVLVGNAVEAIVRLVLASPEEDTIGVVPMMAEGFLDALLDMQRALSRSAFRGIRSPEFLVPWAFASYQDLAYELRKLVDSAVELLLAKYGKEFDISRMANKSNREFSEMFLGTEENDFV